MESGLNAKETEMDTTAESLDLRFRLHNPFLRFSTQEACATIGLAICAIRYAIISSARVAKGGRAGTGGAREGADLSTPWQLDVKA